MEPIWESLQPESPQVKQLTNHQRRQPLHPPYSSYTNQPMFHLLPSIQKNLYTLPTSHFPAQTSPPQGPYIPATSGSFESGDYSSVYNPNNASADNGMLSTALQYLTEKRKRFQRSDTAPAFNLNMGQQIVDPGPPRDLQIPGVTVTLTGNHSEGNFAHYDMSPSLSVTPPLMDSPSPPKFYTSAISGRRSPSPPSMTTRNHIQKSTEHLLVRPDGSMEDLANRRAHSVDFGRRIKASPKAMRNSPSVPTKLNRYTLIKRLTRHNSARSLEELKREFGRNEKIIREAQDYFSAIERGDAAMVDQILSRRPILINTYNDFQLTPLDIAILLDWTQVAHVIQMYGGFNNPTLTDSVKMNAHLTHLLNKFSREILEKKSQTGTSSKDGERELAALINSHKVLKSIRIHFDRMTFPEAPASVTLDIASGTSLLVMVTAPTDTFVTKYRIEWSTNSQFEHPVESIVVESQFPIAYYEIPDLITGTIYYVRVSAMNMRGWGCLRNSQPRFAAPSSWTEVNDSLDRTQTFNSDLVEMKGTLDQELCFWLTSSSNDKKSKSLLNQRKRSLKNLFAPLSKFSRHAKKGVYIGFVCTCEDKIVLAEDYFPLAPVDDNLPSSASLNADVLWLMRLLADCSDLKLLSQNLERLTIPTSLESRVRFVFAAQQLQASVGTSDVGRIFPEVFISSAAAIVVLVKSVEDMREVSLAGGLRWGPLTKFLRRPSGPREDFSSGELPPDVSPETELLSRVEELIRFAQRCENPLPSGLYLCHLRLKCHIDLLQIQHPVTTPNTPPVVKIRDNPHVNRDEWMALQRLCNDSNSGSDEIKDGKKITPANPNAYTFLATLLSSWETLKQELRIDADEAEASRLYLGEVVSLSPDVSIIFVIPPVDKVCSTPGSAFSLPIDFRCTSLNAFETYMFLTYDNDFFARHATLAASLDLLIPIAQGVMRQCLLDKEVDHCRRRVDIFTSAQTRLEEAWKLKRWSKIVISNARDKMNSNKLSCLVSHLPSYLGRRGGSRTGLNKSQFGSTLQVTDPTFVPRNRSSDSGSSYDNSGRSDSLSMSPTLNMDRISPVTDEQLRLSSAQKVVRGTIRVFAAYPSGLMEGTSVKLLVNSQTTSREIVHLVVEQLNQTASLKDPNAPFYDPSEWKDFCLMVSIGVMERPLPDEFHPLLLQHPWKKGKLIIRKKQETIQYSEEPESELSTEV